MARVIVLDASALIALYDSTDAHHEWALHMFRDTLADDLVMNVLTHAETLVHPARAMRLTEFTSGISGLGIRIIGIEPSMGVELARVRVESALRMPDTVVLAQAIALNATIATTDRTLATRAAEFGMQILAP